MTQQAQALDALARSLARQEPKHREIEEAWLAALVEAAGTRYELRLLEASALDLEDRSRTRQIVQRILDSFDR